MAERELLDDVEVNLSPDEYGEVGPTDDDSSSSKGLLPLSKLPTREVFRILQNQWWADRDFSADWRIQANKDFGFVAGEQLSAEDKAYLDSKQRPHVVFNRVLTILKAVAGMEINGRHEIQFLPRNTEDTEVNEILSAASKWMGQGCDAEDEESQAFWQCLITGMGSTEARFSYEEDSQGQYIEEMFDIREFYWDRTARKKNISDSRRRHRVRSMPLSDAMQMFPGKTRVELDATWADAGALGNAVKSIEQKRIRDGDDSEFLWDDRNEVTICCTQWWERQAYWLVADETTNTMVEVDDAKHSLLKERFALLGMELTSTRLTRKVYKQAFLGATDLLKPVKPAPCGNRFSWEVITGEWDAEKLMWFGLTRVMRDPQMWANKFLSQMMHIINSTAKGGVIAETDMAEDQGQFEDSYAQSDEISWVAPGALSGQRPKLMPKPGAGDPGAWANLLTLSISSIKDTVGVNLELLGQQDMQQPGVVEYMRKQAGMTVLATQFDSLRRYRKFVGRQRLYYIQTHMSDGRLIRVVGDEYAGAVRLSKDKTTGEYDVVVGDAPTSPNQKEATWQVIQPMLGVFKEQLMQNPIILSMVLEYSPLPSKLVAAIKKMVVEAQNDPRAQAEKEQFKQIQIRGAVAKIAKDEGSAAQSQSAAFLNKAKATYEQFNALYQQAMADNMVSDNERARMDQALASMKMEIDAMEGHARARKTDAEANALDADAEWTRQAASREKLGALIDIMDGRGRHMESAAGASLDLASAHREREGAISDRKKAVQRRPARAS